MSDYFPDDLLSDVLLRLPLDSLLRARCVSKSWRALIDSPVLAKMHFTRTSLEPKCKSNEVVVLTDQNMFFTLEFDSKDSSIVSAKQLNYPLNITLNPQSHDGDAQLIGSCNGLLCLTNSVNGDTVLWNPWTQKHWVLPSPPIEYSFGSQVSYFRLGFGYEQVNDDYKIVNFSKLYDIFEEGSTDIQQDEVYVYSLRLNSWKRIGDRFRWKLPEEHEPDVGAFANGALHWIVKKRQGDFNNLIVSFDLRNEEFWEIPCPRDPEESFLQHLRVLDGNLCLLSYYYFAGRYRVDLSVMKEYGVEKSWTKLTSIKMPYDISPLWNLTPITYLKNCRELVLQIERDKLVVYDLLTKFMDDVCINGSAAKTPRASCVCLGSLVRPYSEEKDLNN